MKKGANNPKGADVYDLGLERLKRTGFLEGSLEDLGIDSDRFKTELAPNQNQRHL